MCAGNMKEDDYIMYAFEMDKIKDYSNRPRPIIASDVKNSI